ncbi:MAG: amidohydrolase [Burkholderiaceae bacterium]|nr:amidohydrolase [Burkholderiaceae bacterium]
MQAIRRDLHAHPELRFEEHRTAGVVAEKLKAWGYEVTTGVGGTGVVGRLRQGSSSRSLGLRADMDALPIAEANTFEHRSRNPGRMHACGHDGHTTMLLAAAKHLSRHPAFDGTLNLIFQPGEEGGAGARKMIEDGLFTRFHCDAVFGAHNWPGIAVGQFGVTPGPMMGSSNEFEITLSGKGAHAAMPHNGADPVIAATHLVQALQSIITRNKKPIDAAVLSVTEIHAGEATNIIPDSAVIRGTVRTFSIEVLDLVESRMRAMVEQLPPAFGVSARMEFIRNYPPTINDPEQTAFAVSVMRDIVGPENVNERIEPTMGAEDFAFMLLERPGCYIFIGNGDGSHRESGHGMGPCMLHNPSYDFNDELIPIGATLWTRLVERYLPKG